MLMFYNQTLFRVLDWTSYRGFRRGKQGIGHGLKLLITIGTSLLPNTQE
jgi:hypothetical protein